MNHQQQQKETIQEEKADHPLPKEVEFLQKPPPANNHKPAASSPAKQQQPMHHHPPVDKTEIPSRLRDAVKAAKAVNRSSDLVPLTHDYDIMRKNLTTLVHLAKNYQTAYLGMNQARMELVTKYSLFATKSPIFDPIGSTAAGAGDSLAMACQDTSQQTKNLASKYQTEVVDYCVEWERVVTTRIDKELMETHQFGKRLNHYQSKVEGLRKRINNLNHKGKEPPTKLAEKVTRNEKKLDAAWRAHEKSASKLCHLLEEVTLRGWKDLYPLVKRTMNWEVERASEEYDVMARLPVVAEDLDEIFAARSQDTQPEGVPVVPIALADDAGESDSQTTGSFHEDEDDQDDAGSSSRASSSLVGSHAQKEEEEYEIPPAASPPRNKGKLVGANSPKSPTSVNHV